MADTPIRVVGLDHIYLTVSDMARSEAWYDKVLGLLDFRKSDFTIANTPHRHYFNPVMQITIRPAREGFTPHDSYSPGLHHLCLQVASNEDVDRLAAALNRMDIGASAPAFHTDYAPDYYATFFNDPDGLRLEVMTRRAARDMIARRWDEMTAFLNPVTKLKPE
ncbi:MAG: bleomycin resistance protein [Rhizobiales bacterium]|nr:bleomycin resistance protein [Hyphomicrobiales bacterium]